MEMCQYVFKQVACWRKLLLLLALLQSGSSAAEQAPNFHLSAINNTGSNEVFGNADSMRPSLKGGAILKQWNDTGSYLHLEAHSHVELAPPENITAEKGTISMWLKPLWNVREGVSHTILSMRWNGADSSYMVISQGWWEPDGKDRLYFILSNQDYVHCSAEYQLQTEAWAMITVVWSTGQNGFCELYLNDERIARSDIAKTIRRKPASKILIGSDAGSTLPGRRQADFDLLGMFLIDWPLSHEEIRSRYLKAITSRPVLAVDRWKSLEPGLNSSPQRHADVPETRVIFDEGVDWALSRENTDRIIGRISAAGFNVYVPCVWHGRGTYYPTDVAHVDPRVRQRIDSGDDPLGYLVRRAHASGIEVHPWFTVVKREDDRYPRFYDKGTPDGAYNVHNPGFRDFIVDLIMEVVDRYEIDGVNLDYIRAMGICTSDYCAGDYSGRYGHTLELDYYARAVSRSARDRLQLWQDDAVGDIVRRLSGRIRSAEAPIILSLDAHPIVDDSRRPLEGLDAVGFANSGMVDVIYNMDYRQAVDVENINRVRKALKDPDMLITLFGNYEREGDRVIPREPALMEKYISLVRGRWPGSGIAFYLYSMLDDNQLDMLGGGPFASKVRPGWIAGDMSDGK